MKRYSNIKKIFNDLFIVHLFLNITNCLCNIASGYIAGNFLDSIAVSCNSLINPVNTIIIGFASIYSSAGEILCGKFMGVGDKKSINKTFTNSLILSIASGILFTLICFIFSKQIVILLKASNEMIDAASIYFRGYSIGIIAYIIMPVLANFLHMENEGKYVTISVILLTVSYCAFGYLFIKILNLSYFGFGLTNALSQILAALFLFLRIIKNRNQITFEFNKIDFDFSKRLFTLGFPSGTTGMMIGIRNIVLNTILFETGSTVAVAARSVFLSSATLNDAIVTSILQSATMIVSVCIGEKNKDELHDIVKYIFSTIIPIYILLAISQISISRYICSFFSKDIECINLAVNATKLYIPATFFEVFLDIIINIFLIYEYKKFVNVFNISHCILIHIIFAFLTKNILGVYSVFCGYLVTEIVSLAIIIIYIVIRNKKFPTNINELVLIKENFNNIKKYNKTINKYENVTNISKEVSIFIEKHNIDHRRSNLAGLLVEEMCVNIFEHGFTKKTITNPRIDLFVIIDSNDINIRIRDNSIPFDPTTRSIVFNPDDPCKNIGIRMASKLSKEMTYQNVFGFNNMIIKL